MFLGQDRHCLSLFLAGPISNSTAKLEADEVGVLVLVEVRLLVVLVAPLGIFGILGKQLLSHPLIPFDGCHL